MKKILNAFNILLMLSAFYLGINILSGKGLFETYPPEWLGVLPFNSWLGLAFFGMLVFGLGNAALIIYSFFANGMNLSIATLLMGILLFGIVISASKLVGEWYLPSAYILLASICQITIALISSVPILITTKKALKQT